MNERDQLRSRIHAAREDARAALATLQASAGTGGRDLYKQVTGTSSVDNAVAEARRIVEAYDRILRDLDAEMVPEQASIHVIATRGNEIATRGNEIATRGNEIATRGNEIATRGNRAVVA